jgi:hypothetical protein
LEGDVPGVNRYIGSTTIPTSQTNANTTAVPGAGAGDIVAPSVSSGAVDGTITTDAEWAAAAVTGNAGKTYYVRAGSYTAKSYTSLAPASDITFLGFPGEENSISVASVTMTSTSHLKFNGMKIPGGIGLDRCTNISMLRIKAVGAGLNMNGCTDVLVDQCTIGATASGGCITIAPYFAGSTTCTRITVKRSKVYSPNQDLLLLQAGTDVTIEDNEFTGVLDNGQHNDGVVLDTGPSVPGSIEAVNLIVRRNYFHDNWGQNIPIYGDATNSLVENNLVVRTDGALGIIVCAAQKGITIRKNTCWGNGANDMSFREFNRADSNQSTLLTVSNNVFDKWFFGTGCTADSNMVSRDHNILGPHTFQTSAVTANFEKDLTAEPTWSNSATDDYRLASTVTVNGQTFTPGIDWRPADFTYGCGF